MKNNLEGNVVVESENYYGYQTKNGIEIRLNDSTHSWLVGTANSLEQAQRFIDKSENEKTVKYLLKLNRGY